MSEKVKSFDGQRISFIDVSKGIGIILVVLGHLLPSSSPLYIVIYSFHIPFFFMVSGLFARPQAKFRNLIVKQAKHLLLPYVIVFIIGLVFTGLVSGFSSLKIEDIVLQFVYARPIEINVGPIWFFPCLFVTSVLFLFYYKLVLSRDNRVLTIASLGVISIIAFFLPSIESRFGMYLPFKIDVAFMALLFYTVGYLFKDIILSKEFTKGIINKALIIFVSLVILSIFPYFIIGQTYLSGGIYGSDLFLYIFTAFVGSVLILVLGIILEKVKALSYIGKNSLIIFSLHTLLIPFYNKMLELFGMKSNIITSVFGMILILIFMMILSCIKDVIIKKLIKNR